jgi:hypothetical protein
MNRAGAQLPPEVADKIGPFYVYVLIDPRDNSIFYVGKGTGRRLLAHGQEAHMKQDLGPRSDKVKRIKEIRSIGYEPRIDIIRHGLDEDDAFLVESALIASLPTLTNVVSGHGASQGRLPLNELVRRIGATPIEPGAPPVLLIRLGPWQNETTEMEPSAFRKGHGYRDGISLHELADATRGWWRVDPTRVKRGHIRYAVAVYEGVTRGILVIGDWITRDDGRRAFIATPVTSGSIFNQWIGPLGRRIGFSQGNQNPVSYWPPRTTEQ